VIDTPTAAAVLEGQLRTVIAVGGGILVAHGYADNALIAEITGLVMAVVPFVWSAARHIQRARAAKIAEALALNVGIEFSNRDPSATPPIPAVLVPDIIAEIAPTLPPIPGIAATDIKGASL
jgi:hypothetical protein